MSAAAVSKVEQGAVVCHCERVPYAAVSDAVASGARSLRDLQVATRACTRCFGCRFELEQLLQAELGSEYVPTPSLERIEQRRFAGWLPARRRPRELPRRMYMPFLQHYDGSEVTTRVVVFNAPAPDRPAPVPVRIDLIAPSGRRVAVHHTAVQPGGAAVVTAADFGVRALPDGFGALKMVVESDRLHSLRPYFQLVTPGGITTTHEKAGGAHPRDIGPRPYHWLHPLGRLEATEDAFFFCTNTQERPMADQRLVWRALDGTEASYELAELELDASAFVRFGSAFPGFRPEGAAGTVRLDPALHKVAGFMLRHDRGTDRWRVQHL